MPPTQIVSRKRTASEANLTGSEERAPKRHQTNNPRPLVRPHHIKRFTSPPPKIKERPNLFSRAFSRVKDFWNRASLFSLRQTVRLSDCPLLSNIPPARPLQQTSTCLCYLIQTERTHPASPTRRFLARSPTMTIPPNHSHRPQEAPTPPRHPIKHLQQVPAVAHAPARHHRSLNMAKPSHIVRHIRTATPAFNRQVHRHPARIHITRLVELTRALATGRPAKVEKSGGRSR